MVNAWYSLPVRTVNVSLERECSLRNKALLPQLSSLFRLWHQSSEFFSAHQELVAKYSHKLPEVMKDPTLWWCVTIMGIGIALALLVLAPWKRRPTEKRNLQSRIH